MIATSSELVLLGYTKKKRKRVNTKLSRGISSKRYVRDDPKNNFNYKDYFSKLKINPDNYKTLQDESNKAIDKALQKKIDESQNKKGYWQGYNPEKNTITVIPRKKQFYDPQLNPVEDFKDLDNYVTDAIIDTGNELIDDAKKKVTDSILNVEWYWWLIIGAAVVIGIYLLIKLA